MHDTVRLRDLLDLLDEGVGALFLLLDLNGNHSPDEGELTNGPLMCAHCDDRNRWAKPGDATGAAARLRWRENRRGMQVARQRNGRVPNGRGYRHVSLLAF